MRIVSSHQEIREYRNHAEFIKLDNYFSLCIDRFLFVIPSLHCFILCRQNNRYTVNNYHNVSIEFRYFFRLLESSFQDSVP